MSWINPKTNWGNEKAKPDDFNRIEGNTEYLEDLLQTNTSLTYKTWARTSYPYADELNRIERNIETLRLESALPVAFGYLTPKEWKPLDSITNIDLNRMENNLLLLKTMHELIPPNFKYCGTFTCGEVDLI